ncbi:MAG: hypothetical protein LW603_00245 [Sediminibacterium sp.]|nr:hypothetical protein [Sediminibacterium sp.]
MKTIRWGMIGCGSVAEVKSGPAFNKAPHSKLIAVMRRDWMQSILPRLLNFMKPMP